MPVLKFFKIIKFCDFPSFKLFISVLFFRTFSTKMYTNILLFSSAPPKSMLNRDVIPFKIEMCILVSTLLPPFPVIAVGSLLKN